MDNAERIVARVRNGRRIQDFRSHLAARFGSRMLGFEFIAVMTNSGTVAEVYLRRRGGGPVFRVNGRTQNVGRGLPYPCWAPLRTYFARDSHLVLSGRELATKELKSTAAPVAALIEYLGSLATKAA